MEIQIIQRMNMICDLKNCQFFENASTIIANNNNFNSNNITMNFTTRTEGISRMFYLVKPFDYMPEKQNDVPNLFKEAWPYFVLFMILENIIRWIQGKSFIRINDGIVSLSHGIMFECSKLISKGAENWFYIYLYENYKILDLPWNSVGVWYFTALLVDFCYYWVHRASHEIHFLWAQHQVHHSSEDFNLAVGLRQSVFHAWCGFVFYLPMAFFIPPVYFLMHQQFNLLYQFWLHTEVVNTLGPLEFIFNTPNHHRIHHGSNAKYLDKNYGGVLIIWDRLFGTFSKSGKNPQITYGLVSQPTKFNPIYQQIFYNANVYAKWKSMNGWHNKLFAVIKGPSWFPGSKWTGDEATKLNIQDREKLEVELPLWVNIYVIMQFLLIVINFQDMIIRSQMMNPISVIISVIYILTSLTTLGTLLDAEYNACYFEAGRCFIMFLIYAGIYSTDSLLQINLPPIISKQFYIICCKNIFGICSLFWTLYFLLNNYYKSSHSEI